MSATCTDARAIKSMRGCSAKPRELALLVRARRDIAKSQTIDSAKNIADKAEALRIYFKKAGESLDAQNAASEVRLWALRRCGELLAGMEKQGPGEYQRSRDVTVAPSLSEIGIGKMQSSRWQKLAAIDGELFEKFIEDTKSAGKELTAVGAYKLLHKESNFEKESVCSTHGLVESLQSLVDAGAKFSTIYADPPWAYSNKATRSAVDGIYKSTMTLDEIRAEPVAQLTDEAAHLWLWTTTSFLPDAFSVMEAWGFRYVSNVVWVKPQMGIGNYVRVSHEHLLIGVKGQLAEMQEYWNDLQLIRSGSMDLIMDDGSLATPLYDNQPTHTNHQVDQRYYDAKIRRVPTTSSQATQQGDRRQFDAADPFWLP